MIKLFIQSVLRTISSNKVFFTLIVVGITTAVFCLSISMGFSRQYYEEGKNGNMLATISVIFPKNNINKDTITSKISKKYADNTINILYMSQQKEGNYVVGWQGNPGSTWFPHYEGRFFNEKEISQAQKVVYMSGYEYASQVKTDGFGVKNIDGETYQIIGIGSYEDLALLMGLGNYIPQPTDDAEAAENTEDADGHHHEAEDSSTEEKNYSYIIPYTTYFQENTPSIVRIHFRDMTETQLRSVKKELQKEFPLAVVTMPPESADTYFAAAKAARFALSFLLTVIVGITFVGILFEWLKMNRKQYHIYMLCGATKGKIAVLILLEWFAYLLLANVLAYSIHFALLKPLFTWGAGYLPGIGEMVFIFIFIYAITVLFATPKIFKYLDLSSKEDVI